MRKRQYVPNSRALDKEIDPQNTILCSLSHPTSYLDSVTLFRMVFDHFPLNCSHNILRNLKTKKGHNRFRTGCQMSAPQCTPRKGSNTPCQCQPRPPSHRPAHSLQLLQCITPPDSKYVHSGTTFWTLGHMTVDDILSRHLL